MTTIVDIAVNNEGFSTLVTAVSAASLVEVLQSPGPFTVLLQMMLPLPNFPQGQSLLWCRTFPNLREF